MYNPRIFSRKGNLRERASAVIHTDWSPGGSNALGEQMIGVYVLSHNRYTICAIPAWFTDLVRTSVGSDFPSSATYEAFGLVVSMLTFSDICRDTIVSFHNDNKSFIAAMAAGSSSLPHLSFVLHFIITISMSLNTHFVIDYISTHDNLADPMSRQEVDRFLQRVSSGGCSTPPLFMKPPLVMPPSWLFKHQH